VKRCGSILLAIALVSGCSVAAAVKDASFRARESAAKLRQGFDAIAPYVREDVAGVVSLRATLKDRLNAHEQLLEELKAIADK